MGHGSKCDCMACSVGKKIGMIPHEHDADHSKNDDASKKVCEKCGQTHREDGSCGCG